MERFIGVFGIVVLIAIAWSLSSHRRAISWRLVLIGISLQVVLAWLLLTVPPIVRALDALAWVVNRIIDSAADGGKFVFGDLGDPKGQLGFVFAAQALPVIIFFGALMSVLYHVGLMQRVVAGLAWCLRRSLGITGSEALAMAANVFVGQTEAPLVVRPYLPRMTRSQLMLLMTGGFATIAGSVLGVYVMMLGGGNDESRIIFAKHLIIASMLSAPAAVVMAKIMVPETDEPEDDRDIRIAGDDRARNIVDAATVGTTDGLRLAVNVAAMLISFIAILALLNWPLAAFSNWEPIAEWRELNGIDTFSIQMGLGYLFTPIAYVMGVPWQDCAFFGRLLGEKIMLTEWIAFASLSGELQADEITINPRTAYLASYALCGFANLPSIGIQIGGISALAPNRRGDLASLGLRAMLAGACASWCTACVAGLFLPA